MKLLFLTVMPSPYQRQLFAAMAAADGLDVTVRYFVAGAPDREWEHPRLAPYEAVLPGRTLGWMGRSAHLNPGVAKGMAAAAADLVVVSDYSAPTAQIAMRVLARTGRPFIFWGELPGFSQRGALGRFMRRRLQAPLAAATAIAGIGSRAVDAYRAMCPGKPVFNIPYFCDLEPYRAARAARPPRTGETVDVLFSGQLIERKGIDILLEAFAVAGRRFERLRLVLLGGGPQRARFEAMVPVELARRVVFLGHREPADLPAEFARADIFCLPSRHDGWGVVVNEALGAGLPVLVSDAVGAGHDLVVDGANGFVTPAGDVPALVAALERLAGEDALRQRMSAAASEAALHWDLAEGVSRWRTAAQSVLQGRAAA